MNIVIIYPEPDVKRPHRFGFSYEMLLIATVLEKEHNVIIKDYSCYEYNKTELEALCTNKSIDIAIIECDSFALKRSQNIVSADIIIKKLKFHSKTIAYGNYCYITQKDFSQADITIKKNDINLIIDAVNLFDGSKKINKIQSYDDLPYIKREMLFSLPYYKKYPKVTLLQTSKGCENTCIFCQRRGWQDHYVTHSDEYVIEELKLIKELGYKEVWIIDENFTFNLTRSKRLLKKILEESLSKDMSFFISSWANIDNDFIRLAAESNIRIISFGIESGNEEILSYYRKNIKLEKIPKLINYVNDCGIFSVGNFIIGAPMETEETINQTFNLIKKCGFDQVNIKILNYMIGSVLYDYLDESQKEVDSVFACKENGLTNLSLNEMITKKNNFLKEYYNEHRQTIANKVSKFGVPYSFF